MSSSTKSTERVTSIDDLPPEMICELFEYLPPKDLIVCSLVNKRWHSIFAGFKMHRLAVNGSVYDENDLRMGWCPLSLFNHLEKKQLLSSLKHLDLWDYEPEFDLNQLNRFQRLVHLEIGCLPEYGQKKVHLNLPRLKVLTIPNLNSRCALSIDCPLLSTLFYRGEEEAANLLDVKHPETIKRLETRMVSPKWLAQFKCVECLVIEQFRAISKATLRSMPRLRELRYNEDIRTALWNESGHMVGAFDRLKRTLSEFLDEAKKLRDSDFRFRFAGLQLANVNVEQIDFGVQVDEQGKERVSKEYVYMKNYQLIEPGALDFVNEVDYTRLLNNVTGEFPRCFSQKFTSITWVNATAEVQDADHFLWFLKSLKSLEYLVLSDTKLSQKFYDQLPASAPSLGRLLLREGHCEDGLQLNLDFIGRLSSLSCLNIDQPLSLESLLSLVRWLGKLKEGDFELLSREDRFRISTESGSSWMIEKFDRSNPELFFETENLEAIVIFLKGLMYEMLESKSD